MSGRSIFDITDQNFGRLDETIQVANDNNFSLNDEVTEELIIGNYEGDIKKKDAIALQGLTFNNDFAVIPEDPFVGIRGLLDFDGIDDYVSFSTHPDVSGNKTISFKFFNPTGSEDADIIFKNSTSDFFLFEKSEGYIVALSEAEYHIVNNIAPVIDTLVEIEIVKTTGDITSMTINGQAATFTTIPGTLTGPSQDYVGRYDSGSIDRWTDCYIWDLKIGPNPIYPGQPAGNLDPAWGNGVNNGTVNGSPTTIDLIL